MQDKFETYYQMLIDWNSKINLTAITERNDVYLKHFRDSLLIEDLLPKNVSLVDIGTGAGFPGLPLKIKREDLKVTLVDSLKKRVNFLNLVIESLQLSGIIALHKRAEELDKGHKYDYAVSRAVAPLNILCEYCLPFVNLGGMMIAYKANDIEAEVKESLHAIDILGGRLDRIETRRLNEDITRKFVIIKKIKETPLCYPRGGNKPKSKPL